MKKLLIFFISMLPVFGEEKKQEVVSYYLGAEFSGSGLSRFLGDDSTDKPRIEVTFPLTDKWPFESRFLREGDQGFDLTKWFRAEHENMHEVQVAFNRTTGRLVVNATPEEHLNYFEVRMEWLDQPHLISQRVEFFEFPGSLISRDQLHPLKVPKGARKLQELQQKCRIGEKVKVSTPELVWESEVNGTLELDYVGVQFSLNGKVGDDERSYDVDVRTALEGWPELPQYLELGSVGESEETLVMRLTHTFLFIDGTPRSESILREDGVKKSQENFLKPLSYRDNSKAMMEDGRVLARFAVPKTFHQFISTGAGGGDDGTDDPFADPDESDSINLKKETSKLRVAEVDPRVWREQGDPLYNLKPLLEALGVRFSKSDFAQPSSLGRVDKLN